MASSKGTAHAKGRAKSGGRLSTGKGPKDHMAQTGGRPH